MEDQFFVLDTIHASDHRFYAGGQVINNPAQLCSTCGAPIETLECKEVEVALSHIGRRGFVEYLWNSHSLAIFREELIEIWQSSGLTGFDVQSVRIITQHVKPTKSLPDSIPAYYRLVTCSKVQLKNPPPLGSSCIECGFVQYAFPKLGTHLQGNIEIVQTSWDGADFFGLLYYPGFTFCTKEAAEVTLQAGYNKHIAFIRLREWRTWENFDFQKWSPQEYRQYIDNFLIRRPEEL